MQETEMVKFAVQMGMGGIFFWLYWTTNQELRKQAEKHDQDIARLYDMRIQELKQMARLQTDLTADYTMPTKTA